MGYGITPLPSLGQVLSQEDSTLCPSETGRDWNPLPVLNYMTTKRKVEVRYFHVSRT